MKLVTFREGTAPARIGVLIDPDRQVADVGSVSPRLAEQTMIDVIATGDQALDEIREALGRGPRIVPTNDVQLLPPVSTPAQIRDCLCFEEHLKGAFKAGQEFAIANSPDPEGTRRQIQAEGLSGVPEIWYEQPIYYKANRFACSGTGEDIPWPSYGHLLDYELEIGCWIGNPGKDIPRSEAAAHIFGYSIFNDVTARDAQLAEMRGNLGPAKGKDFDKSNVIGPCIVTADEIDPYNLTMVARVNGEEWSRGHSSTMHWKFEDLIAHISRSETLHAGEFLGSGTVGRGCGLELGRFLQPGDVVELEIEGIGKLVNRIGVAKDEESAQ